MNIVTHLRATDDRAMATALATAGLAPGDDGPLVAVLDAAIEPADVTDVLFEWITAARDAIGRGADVVTLVTDDHLDGQDVAKITVGNGLIGATRSYAFEGERDGLVANLVVGPVDQAVATACWLLETRALSGQVLLTGSQFHGRQRP